MCLGWVRRFSWKMWDVSMDQHRSCGNSCAPPEACSEVAGTCLPAHALSWLAAGWEVLLAGHHGRRPGAWWLSVTWPAARLPARPCSHIFLLNQLVCKHASSTWLALSQFGGPVSSKEQLRAARGRDGVTVKSKGRGLYGKKKNPRTLWWARILNWPIYSLVSRTPCQCTVAASINSLCVTNNFFRKFNSQFAGGSCAFHFAELSPDLWA